MSEEKYIEKSICYRRRGNWFKELLYKLKILEPEYKSITTITSKWKVGR